MEKINIAIFVSGGGTNCENLIKYFSGSERVNCALVVSNKADAYALVRAENLGVKTAVVSKAQLNDADVMMPLLREHAIDVIVLAGFLMYCGIASIGGALASKPEDLGTTHSIFTLLLLASFVLSRFGGGGGASMSFVSSAPWMDYVPFTAVMCTPARALLGKVSPLTGIVSLALTLLLAFLAVLAGGRLYRLMIFHRGNPPKPKDIPKLLHLARE